MKQKTARKNTLLFVIGLSLGCFLYVNGGAHLSSQNRLIQQAVPEAAVDQSAESGETRQLPVPSVNLLARLIDLVQKTTFHSR